jgi:hypothetical protein
MCFYSPKNSKADLTDAVDVSRVIYQPPILMGDPPPSGIISEISITIPSQ